MSRSTKNSNKTVIYFRIQPVIIKAHCTLSRKGCYVEFLHPPCNDTSNIYIISTSQ